MHYILIGGGLASATAAEHIRKRDAGGEITIVGAEPHLPYLRPPLSKEYLRGDAEVKDTLIHPEEWYCDQTIRVLQGTSANALDTCAKRVTLSNGQTLIYDRALIATGAEPNRLPIPGLDLPGVHLLRTLDDSTAIRREIERGAQRALIVGGGYIGVEVSADCLQKGVAVTLLQRGRQLWGRFAGPHVAGFLADLLRSKGADLRFGEEAAALTGSGRVAGVRLKSGGEVAGDFAVVGVGVTPRTSLAQAAGLDVDPRQGIHVNPYTRDVGAGRLGGRRCHLFLRSRLRSHVARGALEQRRLAWRDRRRQHGGGAHRLRPRPELFLGLPRLSHGAVRGHAELAAHAPGR
jgi:3-phenylpropionate/trans-cinnamate dioxygenase ferredoxin reductase subunit